MGRVSVAGTIGELVRKAVECLEESEERRWERNNNAGWVEGEAAEAAFNRSMADLNAAVYEVSAEVFGGADLIDGRSVEAACMGLVEDQRRHNTENVTEADAAWAYQIEAGGEAPLSYDELCERLRDVGARSVILTAADYDAEIAGVCLLMATELGRVASEGSDDMACSHVPKLAEAKERMRELLSMVMPSREGVSEAALARAVETMANVSAACPNWPRVSSNVLALYEAELDRLEGGEQGWFRYIRFLTDQHYALLSDDYCTNDDDEACGMYDSDYAEWELGLVSQLGDALTGAMSE